MSFKFTDGSVYEENGPWRTKILAARIYSAEDEMGRTFQYLNDKWSVELIGLSHAAPAGSWAVQFKPVNDPLAKPVHGTIWKSDLTLSDDELRECLKLALVKALKDPTLKK